MLITRLHSNLGKLAEVIVTTSDESCRTITWARMNTRELCNDRSNRRVGVQPGYQHTLGRGGTRRNTPWSPKPGTKEGRDTNDTNCTWMKQRRKNVGTGIPPFVSELGAALLGWSRGYLGFPPHAGGGRNRWRGLIVNVIFLDNLGLGFIEHPVTRMVSAKQHRQ